MGKNLTNLLCLTTFTLGNLTGAYISQNFEKEKPVAYMEKIVHIEKFKDYTIAKERNEIKLPNKEIKIKLPNEKTYTLFR